MSSISPARRLRSKTSDLSDFLRGTGPSSTHPPVPPLPDQQTATKKRRIPFLGRKKTFATLNTAAPEPPRTSTTSNAGTITDSRPSYASHARPSSSQPALTDQSGFDALSAPAPDASSLSTSLPENTSFLSALPPVNVSTSFSPLTSSAAFLDQKSKTSNLTSPSKWSGQSGPSSARTPTDTTRSGQANPRPVQPTITVSVPPETAGARGKAESSAKDIYSSAHAPRTAQRTSSIPQPKRTSLKDEVSSPSPINTPLMRFPMPPATTTRLPMTPSSSRELAGKGSPTSPPRGRANTESSPRSRTNLSILVKRQLDNVLGHSSAASQSASKRTEPGPVVPQSAPPLISHYQTPSPAHSRSPSPKSPRSVVSFGKAPSSPPSIPLPSPPTSILHDSMADAATASASRRHGIAVGSPSKQARARTLTTASLPSRGVRRQQSAFSIDGTTSDSGRSVKDDADCTAVETSGASDTERLNPKSVARDSSATPDQLRRALQVQIAKFDNLAGYVLTLTQKHEEERGALAKEAEEMRHELRKREREIKGLRWLVVNGGTVGQRSPMSDDGAAGGHARQDTVESVRRQLRQDYTDDSDRGTLTPAIEADSPTTGSFDEAEITSAYGKRSSAVARRAAGMGPKQLRRQSSPVVSANPKITSGAGLGLDMSLSDSELSGHGLSYHASASSLSSMPGLTAASTASSGLSAILESPSTGDFAQMDVQREKEERRASKALKRISTSSSRSHLVLPPSPSPPPVHQVSGAVPSIENVLEKGSGDKMDRVLARLRLLGEAAYR